MFRPIGSGSQLDETVEQRRDRPAGGCFVIAPEMHVENAISGSDLSCQKMEKLEQRGLAEILEAHIEGIETQPEIRGIKATWRFDCGDRVDGRPAQLSQPV